MKRFSEFVIESPHETVGTVRVDIFFPMRPDVHWQPLIPDIMNAVRAGDLKPRVQRLALKTLIPTQTTVSLPKVNAAAAGDRPSAHRPLVLLDHGRNILLDGHHRACGEVKNGKTSAEFDTLTASQLADWQDA